MWVLDAQEKVLRCQAVWRAPGATDGDFERSSRERTFVPGVGLPGRVWKSSRPAWIPDISTDDNFPRAPFAAQACLHGAFACPILLGDEVLGVLEFFSRQVREPDLDLLEMMATLGGQIGQFMERRRAEQGLREADRRKDEFLAMLSHELRNPLAPIRNALHIMAAPGIDAATLGHAREVTERQVQHLVRLVDDLLDVSRIMRGKIDLRKQPVELTQVIGGAIEIAQPMIDAHGQQLS